MKAFKHIQSAHCENGATHSLLHYAGTTLSEPMIFGIGSGIFFSYLPFIKVAGAPGFSFRPMPTYIFKRVCKRLGISYHAEKFKTPLAAKNALDILIDQNIPVGLQVGVYHLSYFPPEYRFHFNAHNVVAVGKADENYLISDPVMDKIYPLSNDELNKVRFAKGIFAPKGRLYYPTKVPDQLPIKQAIIKGINQAARHNLKVPVPFFGVKGIKKLAQDMEKWPDKLGMRKTGHYLGQLVRMQEEIGTGGGGFRFIYAAFLQEANAYFEHEHLLEISKEFTRIGDLWRDLAIKCSRVYKNRNNKEFNYSIIPNQLMEIYEAEKAAFTRLLELKLS